MSDEQNNFELADLELVKELKSCHLNGKTDILPTNPTTGDIWEYTPINKTIIYMNKWYELPNLKANTEKTEDTKRNEIVDGLFELLDWILVAALPEKYQESVSRAIEQIESDRETIYALKRDITRLQMDLSVGQQPSKE